MVNARTTPPQRIEIAMSATYDALTLLTPFDIDVGKCRVGSVGDGGYVLADCLRPEQTVLSYGVGWDVTFEQDMAARGHRVFLFDHTIEFVPALHANCSYVAEGIGAVCDAARNLWTIEEHLRRAAIEGSDLILKLDVEGAEWEVLEAIPDAVLHRFEQVTLEVHGLADLEDDGFMARFEAALRKLNARFTLFHVHANNCAAIAVVDGLVVCDVLELSYIRSDRVTRRPSATRYPTALDAANRFGRPDTVLSFFPFAPPAADDGLRPQAARVKDQQRAMQTAAADRFERALDGHRRGDLAGAEALYRDILALDADHVSALNNLALLTPPAEAEYLLTKALALKPDYTTALINLARSCIALGRTAKADAALDQALVYGSDDASAAAVVRELRLTALARSAPSGRAIVGLVRGYRDLARYDDLIARNRAIHEQINAKRDHHYPLILFHEGNIPEDHRRHILARERNARVLFVDVSDHFQFPGGIGHDDMVERWPDGYRFMCRFNSRGIFDLLRSFEMVMRVDEDCILEGVAQDPFDQLAASGQVFATVDYFNEEHYLTQLTLPGAMADILSAQALPVPDLRAMLRRAAYTNLYVTETAFWHRADVRSFTQRLVDHPNFLRFRWGDAPVIGCALHLFAERFGLLPIRYLHGSHNLRLGAPAQAAAPTPLVDVALGASASQSSFSRWSQPFESTLPISGVPVPDFAFHTEAEQNPWWQVDLGAAYPIEAVVVDNRVRACQERARPIRIELAEQETGAWTVVHAAGDAHFGGGGNGPPLDAQVGGRLTARFVRISLDAHDCLHLSRVQVLVRRAWLESRLDRAA